jgi:conjugative relaxase-like TrwC/TraI family protein
MREAAICCRLSFRIHFFEAILLRITAQKSSSQVKSYYERSDYYQEGPSALKGHYFGRGASRLGLSGEVNQEQFERIVDNQHPVNKDESLTPRTRADRRVGWDFTFNVSKSVSIAWALTQDHRILDAVRESVNETLAEIEKDVLTRVHVGKKMHTEKTGNIIAATWLHTTSRPVDGIPMPHLHVHAWLANATHDGKRFKAMDISGVKRDAPYYEARFHSRLADKLQQRLNVAVERQGKKWFEIKGFPREVVERYSERTQQIEEVARKKGITDAKLKAELGAKTRQQKTKAVSPEALPSVWQSIMTPAEIKAVEKQIQFAAEQSTRSSDAAVAVDFAVDHKFSRHSTVRERALVTDAIWRGIGETSIAEIEKELGQRPLIRDGKEEAAWVTTPEVLKEEQWMLGVARKGRGAASPLADDSQVQRDWLSGEQKQAVRQLWNGADEVMILTGKAGTGKTTIAQEAVEGNMPRVDSSIEPSGMLSM